MGLTAELKTLAQRTGGAASSLSTPAERAAFQKAVKQDISNVMGQLNNVYSKLVEVLLVEPGIEPLTLGLSGNTIYTHITAASVADGEVYWHSGNARARSIKETIDVLIARIAELENQLTNLNVASTYDDTALWAATNINDADIEQLRADAFGGNYTLDGDGQADLLYSLAQHVEELGQFFSGFPGTGVTGYANAYPALTLDSSMITFTGTPWTFETTSGVTSNENGTYAVDDFVFGSPVLNDDGDINHDSRFSFDKSNSSFAGGIATGTEMDVTNRGTSSFSWGTNVMASGGASVVFGESNTISGAGQYSGILSGSGHVIQRATSVIAGGNTNQITTAGATNSIVGGYGNTISGGAWQFIGAGNTNTISSSSSYNVITGGDVNTIDLTADHSFIGGGFSHLITADYAAVVGGNNHEISSTGAYGFIGGGASNTVSSPNGVIGGGQLNVVAGTHSSVVGGTTNNVQGTYSVISGGQSNGISNASSANCVVAGGTTNVISAGSSNSTIGGGATNTISSAGTTNTIGGGASNTVSGLANYVTISGGQSNTSSQSFTFIGGGFTNAASNTYAVVAGGDMNTSSGLHSCILGGDTNTASGQLSVVGGGLSNLAQSQYSGVFSGNDNSASGTASVVAGGDQNIVTGTYSVIGGGYQNQALANYTAIVGGNVNVVSGLYSSILGGSGNNVTGTYGAIVGGLNNSISVGGADNCFIGGGNDNIISGTGNQNAIVAGQSNDITATSSNNVIVGGTLNTISATGNNNVIVTGESNTISTSGKGNVIVNGYLNTISGTGDFSATIGRENTVTGSNTLVIGREGLGAQDGMIVHSDGMFVSVGDAQVMQFLLRGTENVDGSPYRLGLNQVPTDGIIFLNGQSAFVRFEGIVKLGTSRASSFVYECTVDAAAGNLTFYTTGGSPLEIKGNFGALTLTNSAPSSSGLEMFFDVDPNGIKDTFALVRVTIVRLF